MKYSANKTILSGIGVTNDKVKIWLKKGLILSYPMLQNKKYYISEDGFAFVENADKYVIPLSKKETELYTKHPEIFKQDFLKNVRLYIEFVNWLHSLRPQTDNLNPKEILAALLSILYLFQRGMDHHYYHFDRYLVYQDYPDTPVGYWWNNLKIISKKIAKEKYANPNNLFLELLATDDKTPIHYKRYLTNKEFTNLSECLRQVRIFEDCQDEEARLIVDFEKKENIFFRTAIPIWDKISRLLKTYPELSKVGQQRKIIKILTGHPLVMIRVLLSPEGLNDLNQEILEMFETELKRWIQIR